ncbi:hypothetical protein C8R45DRAFT_918200 [Mycena sanguinolenta]|nr:hypothetical protein C8R45DRAFT_918200 [Mycena sanguinolenta]
MCKGSRIDQVAEEERWFRPKFDQPPFALILQYLARDLSLDDTVNQLIDPINSSYSTADFGNAIRRTEETAVDQRTFFSSEEEARVEWGDPLPEGEIPPAPEGTLSTEGQNNGHAKLVALVAAIKRVPDPPLLVNATKALRNDWIWEGTLWSTLLLLGAASRETWNDSPGGQFGYSKAAIAAWANVNAFVARLTAENTHWREEEGDWLDATVPAAAAWIGVWGKEMYARREDLTPTNPIQGGQAPS